MTQIVVKQTPSIGYRIPVNGVIYNPMTKDWPVAAGNYFKSANQQGDLPEGLRGDPRFDS